MSHQSIPHGIKKRRSEVPRLFAVIDEVAGRLHAPSIDVLFLNPFSNAAVTDYGSRFGIFGGTRVLTLGLILVEHLTLPELKALLAHELAHFSHQDIALGRYVHHVTMRLFQMIHNLRTETEWYWANPAYWLLAGYLEIYGMFAHGFERKRELWADGVAAKAYGGDVTTACLQKTYESSMFQEPLMQLAWKAAQARTATENLFARLREIKNKLPEANLKRLRNRFLREEPESHLHSHPPLRDRVAHIKGIPPVTHMIGLPGVCVFEDPIQIEKELSTFLISSIRAHRNLCENVEARGKGYILLD